MARTYIAFAIAPRVLSAGIYGHFLFVPFSPPIEKERKGPSTTEQQHHSLAELKGAQYAAIFFIQRYHLAGIGMKTGPGPE
ncbi:MAG TPA: hypothetical protein VMU29_06000, partial [Smithella sp.]|nr:hypothetical protein [Smithella sp.]